MEIIKTTVVDVELGLLQRHAAHARRWGLPHKAAWRRLPLNSDMEAECTQLLEKDRAIVWRASKHDPFEPREWG